VAFINAKPGLSNYGRYVVLMHRWDGVTVFSLYAHLREMAEGLAVGQDVRRGQRIATLGRSTNTREGISVDRAHLHLEIAFMLNPHFRTWYQRRDPKAPPFGNFNGKNLMGLNPAELYQAVAANPQLNFAEYVARLPLAFTVLVRADKLPWAQLHPEQVVGDPRGATAYEVGFTAWGLPVQVWPRTNVTTRLPALSQVNASVLAGDSCSPLVERHGQGWRLTNRGTEFLGMLIFTP